MPATFTATEWVELIVALTLPLTAIGFAFQRAVRGGPISSRTIQIVGILLFLPSVLILGLEKDISDPVLGPLLAAAGGFLLSAIGKEIDGGPRAAESAQRPSASV